MYFYFTDISSVQALSKPVSKHFHCQLVDCMLVDKTLVVFTTYRTSATKRRYTTFAHIFSLHVAISLLWFEIKISRFLICVSVAFLFLVVHGNINCFTHSGTLSIVIRPGLGRLVINKPISLANRSKRVESLMVLLNKPISFFIVCIIFILIIFCNSPLTNCCWTHYFTCEFQ